MKDKNKPFVLCKHLGLQVYDVFGKKETMNEEHALKELEKIGYKAKIYSPNMQYKSGAILPDGKIIEIGTDDHSILRGLPNKLTYRFVNNKRDLYFRIPITYTEEQINTAIKISPDYFEYIVVDILDEKENIINSFDKEFKIGRKVNLRKFFEEVVI